MIRIESDEKYVYANGRQFSSFMLLNNYLQIPAILRFSIINGKTYYTKNHLEKGDKALNQNLAHILGVKPKKWAKAFNYHMFKVWVDPLPKKYVNEFAFKRNKQISPQRISELWARKDCLDTCVKEGKEHLIPFAFRFGFYPNQIREKFHPKFFNIIRKNSFYRNKIIAYHPLLIDAYTLDKTEELCDIPTTLLKYNISNINFYRWFKKYRPFPMSHKKEVYNLLSIFAYFQNHSSFKIEEVMNWEYDEMIENFRLSRELDRL